MDTLAEFLLARLAEDFEVAQRENAWPNGKPRSPQDWEHVAGDADSMLVGMFSPARVLAEVEAKRQIIAEVIGWEHSAVVDVGGGFQSCSEGDNCRCGTSERQLAILQPMAAVYAKHPDYREFEWWAP